MYHGSSLRKLPVHGMSSGLLLDIGGPFSKTSTISAMSHGLLNALGGAPYPIPLDQELDLVQTESQGSDFSDEVIKGHAPSLCSLGVSLPEFQCPGNTTL